MDYLQKRKKLKEIELRELQHESLKDLSMKERKRVLEKRRRAEKLAVSDRISHLERLENEDEADKLNVPYPALDNFTGPLPRMVRSDKRWIWGIITLLGLFTIYGIFAIRGGEHYRLYSGLDFRSLPCGKGNLTVRPYLYWPSPNVDINVRMCVHTCPNDTGRKICLYHPDGRTLHKDERFCYTAIQTQQFGRYCVPRESETKVTVDAWIVSWENIYRRALGDIALAKDVILVGFLVGSVAGLIILILMSYKCSMVIWTWLSMVITLNAVLIMAGFSHIEYLETIKMRCYNKIDQQGCGGQRSSFFYFLTRFFLVAGGIYLIAILYFCRKIHLATKLMKRSIFLFKRTWQMKSVLLIGIISMIALTFFALLTMISAGSYGPNDKRPAIIVDEKYMKFIPSQIMRIILWFDIPLTYIFYLFIIAILELLACYSTCTWYFSRKKKEATLPTSMVLKTALLWHTGTAAKIATLKVFFKFLKNIAWFIKVRLRALKQDSNWTRFAIATFLPLIVLYEKNIKYVTKDCLPNVVMWGDNYFEASKKSFFLTRLRHFHEGYNTLPYVKFILFSSKCALSMIISIFVYVYCSLYEKSFAQFDLTIMDTPMVPYLFTFFTGLFFSTVFFIPYDMILRTTLQCYAIDCEMFVGDQRFTEAFIQEFITDYIDLGAKVVADRSIFCFGCICRKKKAGTKIGAEDAEVIFDEEEELFEPDKTERDDKKKESDTKEKTMGDEEDGKEMAKGEGGKKKEKAKGEKTDTLADAFQAEEKENLIGKTKDKVVDNKAPLVIGKETEIRPGTSKSKATKQGEPNVLDEFEELFADIDEGKGEDGAGAGGANDKPTKYVG